MAPDNETTWLAQALDGDDEAFAHIVETYQRPVFSVCYRMLGNAGDAEDAAQESFLRAYKNLYRYDPNRSFATWLLSIASHYCIDQLRKRRLTTFSIDDDDNWWQPPDPGPSPENVLAGTERRAKVVELLDTLKHQDRAVVVLHYWHDYSYEEIAETLELSVSAVKSRLYRARRTLAKGWQEKEHQEKALESKNAERVPYETQAF
ncbi:MAG: sigma-70 family RNA polymerase sigma factor [Chloroflexota bacterium]